MQKHLLLSCITVITFVSFVFAQAPSKQWDARFGGTRDDLLTSLQQTSDGGYILGGSSLSGITGDKSQASQGGNDYWILKTNSSGIKQWDARFGGSGEDLLQSLIQTSDGGYLLGGYSNSGISGDKTQASQGFNDYWIVKVNGSGVKQWDARFGGSGTDELYSLQQTSDGGYILGGRSNSVISGDKTQAAQGSYDYWVVKINSSGVKQWDFRFGGSGDDELYSLQQTSDGGYILGGFSSSGISGDKTQATQGAADYWIVKVNSSGGKQWDFRFGGNNSDILFSLQQTSDLGYILGGYSSSIISGDKTQASQGSTDYWIVKVNSSGGKQWDARFGGSSTELLYSLQQTSEGGYILGGYSNSGVSGDKTQASQGADDYWIVKVNGSGVKQWDARNGGSTSEELYSLQQTSDGGYILGGYSYSGISGDKTQTSQGGSDYWIVKLTDIITNPITGSPFCAGGNVNVPYTSVTFNAGNIFTAQLSNASGSFASPTNIGTLTSTTSGTINATIPAGASSGSGYRIRVISSNPAHTGSDNGNDITINALPVATITPGSSTTFCPGGNVTLTANTNTGYLWSTGATTQNIITGIAGNYTVTVTDVFGCSATSAATTVTVLGNAAAVPSKQWDARFGGSSDDELSSLQQTNDGGYILGGYSLSGISGDKTQASQGLKDYWIVKVNSSGVKQWDARFGGSSDDYLTSLQQTNDSGYILGGYSFSGVSGDKTQASQGSFDYWIVKVNSSGVKQWDARYGGSGNDELQSLQQTSDGGYILGGRSFSGISADKTQTNWDGSRTTSDYWIVKVDSSGVKQWDARFGGSSYDWLYAVQQTNDGGYILGGKSTSGISGDKTQGTQGSYDYWIVKVNSSGVKQWDATFGGSSNDELFSLQQTNDGEYILGGFSQSGISGDKTQASQGFYDYWIVKVSSSGVKQWDARFGGGSDDYLSSLQQTNDGGYILGGYSISGISGDRTQASQGSYDYWIVKVNSSGVKQWDARFGGSSGDLLYSLQQTNDGGYILGGYSNSGISGDKTQVSQGLIDYWIVKLKNIPTITPGSSTTFCNGDSVILTASAGNNYLWSNGLTAQSITVKTSGNYSVTVDDCTASDAVIVTVNPRPAATISANGSTTFCPGGSVTLTAISNANYLWNNGATTQNITTGIAGNYSVTVTDTNGCSASSTPVNVNSPGTSFAASKQWDARFGGSSNDYFYSLQQTSDGGYILGGYSGSGISGDKTQSSQGSGDYWIVKVNSSGVKQWDARYGGSGNDILQSLQQTSDGGYILGGKSSSGISGDKTQISQGLEDYWIVKVNSSGVKEWDARFGGSINDDLVSLQQTSDGGYILGGYSTSGVSGDKTQASQGLNDYWVVKVSSSGVKLWDARFGGNGDDFFESVQQTSDGGYILGGYSISPLSGDKTQASQGSYDYWIVKVNSSGVKEWDARFGGSINDDLVSLQQTSDGGYILGGYSNSGISGDKTQASQGSFDYWIVKVNSSGVKQWDARFGGSGDDALRSLEQTSDGGYILGGSSNSGISGDKTQASQGGDDYWIVKINSSGVKQWDGRFGGNGSEGISSLQQTNDGGYILGGSSNTGISGDKTQASRGTYDYWIVKLNNIPTITTTEPTTFCKGDSVILTASAASTYLWSNAAITQTISATTTGNYLVTVDQCYTSDTTKVLTTYCTITINLKAFIQGFYIPGADSMQAVVDPGNFPTLCDSVTLALADSATLQITASDFKPISTHGIGVFNFLGLVPGHRYYLVLQHRNALETWSKYSFLFDNAILNFDFTRQ